jgi:hypothetical protein
MAVQGGGTLSQFDSPVNVTIAYSDMDIRLVTDEGALMLMWWDGSSWIDAAQSCSPPSVYTRGNNSISLGICRDGRYGLFGPSIRGWLPVVIKN